MQGFSWVIEGKVAGLPMPGDWSRLENDLRFLKSKGIGLLFSLTERAPDASMLANFDIASVHLPVQDFAPPTQDQLARFVAEANVALEQGKAVGVHCRAGMGRTGTFLAAYLISQGHDARSAIETVRRKRPGSIETREQEAALESFAASNGLAD